MAPRKYLKRSHRALDQWLEKLGYYRKCTARDETCLFRAISEQLYSTQIHHEQIRSDVIKYIRNKRHFVDNEYIRKLESHMIFCGRFEINICSLIYKHDIILFDGSEMKKMEVLNNGFSDKFLLCFIPPDHYDSVFSIEYIETTAYCQSLTYKILYENVFNIENIDSIVSLMLHSDKEICLSEVNNNYFQKGKENKIDISTASQQFMVPFSFKIAKALDPNIYRNIEFDCWNEIRRELRYKQWYMGGRDFKVGVECYVQLQSHEDKPKKCYIQEILSDGSDMYVVYILEEARTTTVRKCQLEPLPQATPWPLPSRYFKNISKSNQKMITNKEKAKVMKTQCSTKNVLEIATLVEKNVNQMTNGNTQNEDTNENLLSFQMQPCSYENTLTPIFNLQQPEVVRYTSTNEYLNLNDQFNNLYMINLNVCPSFEDNGSDLPFNDIPTLRFFFNKGIELFNSKTPEQHTYQSVNAVPPVPINELQSPLHWTVAQPEPLQLVNPISFLSPCTSETKDYHSKEYNSTLYPHIQNQASENYNYGYSTNKQKHLNQKSKKYDQNQHNDSKLYENTLNTQNNTIIFNNDYGQANFFIPCGFQYQEHTVEQNGHPPFVYQQFYDMSPVSVYIDQNRIPYTELTSNNSVIFPEIMCSVPQLVMHSEYYKNDIVYNPY